MDKDHLHVQFQTYSNERIYRMDKEDDVEVPRAEVKTSIRKSPRLQSKEKLSSCSPEAYKYTVKFSVSESKIQEENRPFFQHKNGNSDVFSSHTASMKSSTVVPFLKYQVHAKDGIQLVVDLNVKQSDWLKSMEKEVCTRQNNLKPGCENFRKEVECLGYRNNLKFSSPGKTTTLDTSVSVENKFSHNLTSIKTGKSLTSAIEKEVTNVSGCLSKVDQGSELVSESLKVHEIGSPEAECPEIVVFTSEQVQFPDFSKHHKGSVCSTTGKICSEGLLTSTAEADQVTCDNHRHSKERTNSAEGMQVSGDKRVFETSASNDGPKRKKCDYESNNIHGQSHARHLRSTKLYGGQIFESGGCLIRRSSRLLS